MGRAVKNALKYMGTDQRHTRHISRIHHSLHHGSITLADRLYCAMLGMVCPSVASLCGSAAVMLITEIDDA
jgi:hypothetical protein